MSPATIRRDLAMLEEQQLLGRMHGGAVGRAVSYELPLRYKSVRYGDEKRRIAIEAASRVTEGMAVGLTGGTTATELAQALADRRELTIVTNALNIASELAIRPDLKLVVTGGVARSQSYELSGPIAEATLDGLNLDVAFVGVDGIEAKAGLHDLPGDRGAHQRRHDRAGQARDRGRRRLEDRPGRLRPDVPASRGR